MAIAVSAKGLVICNNADAFRLSTTVTRVADQLCICSIQALLSPELVMTPHTEGTH